MKLRKLIDIMEKAASLCDGKGEECDVAFIVDDDDLELTELTGEGIATLPFQRGELVPFPGWQEKFTFRFRVIGAEYNQPKGCPCPSHHPSCDCNGSAGDR